MSIEGRLNIGERCPRLLQESPGPVTQCSLPAGHAGRHDYGRIFGQVAEPERRVAPFSPDPTDILGVCVSLCANLRIIEAGYREAHHRIYSEAGQAEAKVRVSRADPTGSMVANETDDNGHETAMFADRQDLYRVGQALKLMLQGSSRATKALARLLPLEADVEEEKRLGVTDRPITRKLFKWEPAMVQDAEERLAAMRTPAEQREVERRWARR